MATEPYCAEPVEDCDGAHMTIIPLADGDVPQCRRCGCKESLKTGKVMKAKVAADERRGSSLSIVQNRS